MARHTPLLLCAALACAAASATAAPAQLIDHTFDFGANPDGWVAWDPTYSAVVTGGGNPLEHLRLDNRGGSPTCPYVFIEPRGTAPLQHRGNWRAAGVRAVSADIDVRDGRFGGIFCVFLVSDPGTPSNPNDDCMLVLIHPDPAPLAPGWTRYEFPLPAASTTPAAGWFAAGACSNANLTQVWNSVLVDVDRMFFVLDAAPGQSCTSTFWDLHVDNISVRAGAIGTVYCASRANSSGGPAQLQADGSTLITANDVRLRASGLPLQSVGYFLFSATTARTSVLAGDLCLGAPLRRFSLSVQSSGTTGAVSFSPDLTNLPLGTVVTPGSTWNFQYWFRDVGPTANFSEGLALRFE